MAAGHGDRQRDDPPRAPVTNPDTAASRTCVATSRRIASSRSPPAVMGCSSAVSTAGRAGRPHAIPSSDDLRDEPFPQRCERLSSTRFHVCRPPGGRQAACRWSTPRPRSLCRPADANPIAVVPQSLLGSRGEPSDVHLDPPPGRPAVPAVGTGLSLTAWPGYGCDDAHLPARRRAASVRAAPSASLLRGAGRQGAVLAATARSAPAACPSPSRSRAVCPGLGISASVVGACAGFRVSRRRPRLDRGPDHVRVRRSPAGSSVALPERIDATPRACCPGRHPLSGVGLSRPTRA